MAVGAIMDRVCLHLKNVPMKVLCVLLVALQAFFLDAIIIYCYGDGEEAVTCRHCEKCYWWISGDVLIIIAFVVTFVVSYRHLEHYKSFKRYPKTHMKAGLPLSCMTWLVYSAYVSARVVVIFKSTINDSLDDDSFYGPQFLKTGISLTGAVFLLFVAAHHHQKETALEKAYINSLATGVTFDILDTVDFLDILFVRETHVLVPYPMENAIMVISVLNLLRPTFSFLVLSLKHYGASKMSRELSAANSLVSIFLVNIPFLVVRMILWHSLNTDMSVFLIKNFILVFLGIHELHEISLERREEQGDPNSIEMVPTRDLTLPHRPSDLQDTTASAERPPDYRSLVRRAGADEDGIHSSGEDA